MNSISVQIPSITENIRMIESFIDNAKERFQLDEDIYGNIIDLFFRHACSFILYSNCKHLGVLLATDYNAAFFTEIDGIGYQVVN